MLPSFHGKLIGLLVVSHIEFTLAEDMIDDLG